MEVDDFYKLSYGAKYSDVFYGIKKLSKLVTKKPTDEENKVFRQYISADWEIFFRLKDQKYHNYYDISTLDNSRYYSFSLKGQGYQIINIYDSKITIRYEPYIRGN